MTGKKIKLAMVMPFYLPVDLSGSGRVGQWLAEGLVKKGFDCTVFTSDCVTTKGWYLPFGKRLSRKPERIGGVRIYRLACRWWYSLFCLAVARFLFVLPEKWLEKARFGLSGPNLAGLMGKIKKGRFDVVWVMPFPVYLNFLVVKAVREMKKRPKLVMTPFFHESLGDYRNKLLGHLLKEADMVQVMTKAEGRILRRLFGLKSDQLVVGGMPFPVENLREVEEMADEVVGFKRKHDLLDKKLILFAGNKIKEKGLGVLTEAVGELYGQEDSYRLLVMGKDTAWWKKFKRGWESKGFLLDLGYREEKEKEVVFAAADVFCMPSECESLGIVYLEAWQKKKPVIGARISAVEELMRSAGGGELVRFGDKKGLKKVIRKLVGDDSLAESMGESGYRFVRGKLDTFKVWDQVGGWLKELMKV